MAITIVQTATNFNGSAATGLAVPISTPTAGNRIVAVLSAATVNANVSEVTGLFTEDRAANISAASSVSIWSKLSDGTENVVQWAFSVSCINEAIVYEISGLTKGPVYVDASTSASPASNTSVTAGPIAAIRANNEFIMVGVGFNATSGAFVSVTNSYVFDGPVSSNNRLIPAHLIQTVANATQQTVVTWTTSRPPGVLLVAYLGNDIDFLPAAALFRNQLRRRRPPVVRRGRMIPRMFAGTPSMHDVRIPRRRRPVQRARRPDFIQDTPDVAPLPVNFNLIAPTKRRRNFRRDRPTVWTFVPVTTPTTPPAIILELIRAQVRPRFKYTQRHGLFIFPIPSSAPPPPDPIVIEPISGFLVTDGRTWGMLVTDGETTGFLITDGRTTTVLIT